MAFLQVTDLVYVLFNVLALRSWLIPAYNVVPIMNIVKPPNCTDCLWFFSNHMKKIQNGITSGWLTWKFCQLSWIPVLIFLS